MLFPFLLPYIRSYFGSKPKAILTLFVGIACLHPIVRADRSCCYYLYFIMSSEDHSSEGPIFSGSEYHRRYAVASSKQFTGLSGSGDPSKLTSKPKASSGSSASASSSLAGSSSVPEISRSSVVVEAPLPFKGTGTPNGEEPTVEERADAEAYLREILAMDEFLPLAEHISLVARPHPNMKATAFKTVGMIARENPYDIASACLLYTSPSPRDS